MLTQLERSVEGLSMRAQPMRLHLPQDVINHPAHTPPTKPSHCFPAFGWR